MCTGRPYGVALADKKMCASSPFKSTAFTLKEFISNRPKTHKFLFNNLNLLGLWNQWHRGWLKQNQFRVVWLRYEDLLFFPTKTFQNYCRDKGSRLRAVSGQAKSHGNPANLSSSLERYANSALFLDFFRAEKDFIVSHLDLEVMDFLNYSVPYIY